MLAHSLKILESCLPKVCFESDRALNVNRGAYFLTERVASCDERAAARAELSVQLRKLGVVAAYLKYKTLGLVRNEVSFAVGLDECFGHYSLTFHFGQ